MRVKCLAQEHNTMSPARARTQSARSGVERANHEATVPPTLRQNYKLINNKQSILYYTRLPGDFRLIKVIGHASFASSAVFLFSTFRHEVTYIFEDFPRRCLAHTIELTCRITAGIGMKCQKRLPLLLYESGIL